MTPAPRESTLAAEPKALIELLIARVEQSESPLARAALLMHIAQLYEHELGDPDRAFTALLAADLDGDHAERRDDLERLAARTGRWDELAAQLAAQIPVLDVVDRASAYARLGCIYLDRLGDRERALVAIDAALACEPAHEVASRLRVPLLLEEAVVHRRLGELARAKACCRRALDLDGSSTAAMAALERLVREGGDLDELLELIDERVRTASQEERCALMRESAAHYAARGRNDEAIRRYEKIRADIPADVETLHALERLYAVGHPREHVEVLAALAGSVSDGGERAVLCRRLAAGWEALGDPARAAEALEWIVSDDGGDDATYDELARLYLAARHWQAAIDAISRHAERTEATRRPALYLELGMLFEEHVEDLYRAIDYYEKANELAPGSDATLVALARLYELTGAHERAASRLEDAAGIARTVSARVGRLARAAMLLAEQGSDRVKWCERLLREALALHPGFPPAARVLAKIHRDRGGLRRAADLLAGAVNHAADEDERVDLLIEAGGVEEALGEEERALAYYRRAIDADPARRDARVHASEMLYALGRDHELVPLLEQLCDDEPDVEVCADRLVRLARVLEATGDRARAFKALAHAEAVVPGHAEARRVEGELLFAEGRWSEARRVLTRLAEAGGDLTVRELAHVQTHISACAMALADSEAAVHAIEEALRLDPDHLVALKRAVELYAELGRWLDALAAAERIATIDPDRRLRARYWAVAARICAEELCFTDDALAHYRRALDEDAELTDAALDLERLLTISGDQVALVAHYTQRIQQLGPAGSSADAERVRLWSALGDACEVMGDRDAARIAFEVCTTLDGARVDLRVRLADACLAIGGAHLDRAITEHQEILARDKTRVASYRALAELYRRTDRPQRARACAAAANQLVSLRLAEGSLEDLDTSMEAWTGGLARRPLDEQEALLRHRDEDPLLSALWSRISTVVMGIEATPRKALRLRDAVAIDDERPFARACRETCRLLSAPMPELFTRQEQLQRALFINAHSENTLQPLLVVGTPLLGDRRLTSDLVFSLTLRLSNLRPDRVLRLALPDPSTLALLVESAFALVNEVRGKGRVPFGRTGEALRTRLSPIGFDQTLVLAERLAERGEDGHAIVTRWLRAVDFSAARTAFALTGDLAGALRNIATDDQAAFASSKERLIDLIWCSATDEFAAVRARVAETAPVESDAVRIWHSAEYSVIASA